MFARPDGADRTEDRLTEGGGGVRDGQGGQNGTEPPLVSLRAAEDTGD